MMEAPSDPRGAECDSIDDVQIVERSQTGAGRPARRSSLLFRSFKREGSSARDRECIKCNAVLKSGTADAMRRHIQACTGLTQEEKDDIDIAEQSYDQTHGIGCCAAG
jgi:hypothetical protein